MGKLNVAIVGAGNMGNVHATAYSKIDEAQIVAVCDVDLNKAKTLADKVGAEKTFGDHKDAFKEKIDIADICVPTFLHPPIAVDAAEAGINVICEKPIALSLKEADQMIEAAGRSGVKFMVAHVVRFMPEYRMVKELAESKEMGRIISAFGGRYLPGRRGEALFSGRTWFADPALSGGPIVDLHIHDLDFLNWLFGTPQRIFCDGIKSENGMWNHVFTTLSYREGKGFAVASSLMPKTFRFMSELRVIYEEGAAEINTRAEKTLTIFRGDKAVENPVLPGRSGYQAEVENFAQCVLKDVQPAIITPQDARLALETAIMARESAEKGMPLTL